MIILCDLAAVILFKLARLCLNAFNFVMPWHFLDVSVRSWLLFGLKLDNFYFGHFKLNFLRRKCFWMINSNFFKNNILTSI